MRRRAVLLRPATRCLAIDLLSAARAVQGRWPVAAGSALARLALADIGMLSTLPDIGPMPALTDVCMLPLPDVRALPALTDVRALAALTDIGALPTLVGELAAELL